MNTSKASNPGRVVCRGSVRVPVSAERALHLFTPRGEREWAEGWDPVFPAEPRDDGAPGTVFVTHADVGRQAIWMVVHRTEHSMRYARAVPGVWAGTVEVRCEPAASHTVAHVTYDLTALDDAERPRLREFAAGYDAFLHEWEHALAAALDPSS
jgi:hypothetical protein